MKNSNTFYDCLHQGRTIAFNRVGGGGGGAKEKSISATPGDFGVGQIITEGGTICSLHPL